ncbi:uncharacterized protein LOC111333196 [Stylophora pistillata]|uniref:Universal stress protein Slr1101 n=1 Tax=Stylophora pistillata TaxID=50429 RepID=A0A2B4S3A3_STYPI|nr:uncharacterized protein LOC111333196 [Stylophora pistillata]PFX23260.1 Universal stress protein Slr1101 [Stylophora pistillata]
MNNNTARERRVVIGVDRSQHSARAFQWYVKNMCNAETDRVLVVHAYERPAMAVYPYAHGHAYYEALQLSLKKDKKELEELWQNFEGKCKHYKLNYKLFKEESSRPGEAICKVASDEDAHVIVVGSRGCGTLRRTFLGSVSDYCLHQAHIPVAIIPPPS